MHLFANFHIFYSQISYKLLYNNRLLHSPNLVGRNLGSVTKPYGTIFSLDEGT